MGLTRAIEELGQTLKQLIGAARKLLASDDLIVALITLVGLIFLAIGMWMIYQPLAFLLTGSACLGIGWLYVKGTAK